MRKLIVVVVAALVGAIASFGFAAPAMAMSIACNAPTWSQCGGIYTITASGRRAITVQITDHGNGGTAVRIINAVNGGQIGITRWLNAGDTTIWAYSCNVYAGVKFYVQVSRRIAAGDAYIAGVADDYYWTDIGHGAGCDFR